MMSIRNAMPLVSGRTHSFEQAEGGAWFTFSVSGTQMVQREWAPSASSVLVDRNVVCSWPLQVEADVQRPKGPLPSAATIFVNDLGDERLRLLRAVPVHLEVWPTHVSARWYDLGEFGIGEEVEEAILDLKESVVDLYFVLKREQAHLGPLPAQQWRLLQGVICER